MTVPLSRDVDRIPPSNLEAEMALLGSILVDREIMGTVSEIVKPNDFYASFHETIFQALFALHERGEPLDKITLAEELKQRGLLDKIGGLAYLTSLMDTVPTAASAEYYARIVHEKATLRKLIHAGTQITQIGYEAEEDVEGAVDRAEQIVYDVGQGTASRTFIPVANLLVETFQRIDHRYHQGGDQTGLTSGFRDIDQFTAGFQPGNLVIVAARPAMGKTSIALTMAVAAAKKHSKPIAIFSLEMTSQEIVERLMCTEARLNAQKLRKGEIEKHEWGPLGESIGILNDLPIFIDDSGSLTVTEIRSRCRRLKSTEGLACIFIDYLQLIRPSTAARQTTRNEELSEICRTLKATAKELEVPIVALAQLNRAVETRPNKRPMLSDLRDCLAGDSLVVNADTGERATMRDIAELDLRFNVWAIDERYRLVRRPIVDAWLVNEQPVFRLTTQSGRTLKCTAGHRFLSTSGWRELRDFVPGDSIAVPRLYETPLRPATITADRALNRRDQGKRMSPATLALVADRLGDADLSALAPSDVLWDEISTIEPLGIEPVYDVTVGDLHNFCVEEILTHNSGALEQEADMVAFLYRDAYYNPESAPEPDLTEFIIAKQRNGPTGTVRLRFQKEHTTFVPYGDEHHYSAP